MTRREAIERQSRKYDRVPGVSRHLRDEHLRSMQELSAILEADAGYLGRLNIEAEALRRNGQPAERIAQTVMREKNWGKAVVHFLELARQNKRDVIYFGAGSFGQDPETLRPAAEPVVQFMYDQFPELHPVILPDEFGQIEQGIAMMRRLNEIAGQPYWGERRPEDFAAVEEYLVDALPAGQIISRSGVRDNEVRFPTAIQNDIKIAGLVHYGTHRHVGMYMGDVKFRNIGFILEQKGKIVTTLDSASGWHPSGTLYPLPDGRLSQQWQVQRRILPDPHRPRLAVESRSSQSGFTRSEVQRDINATAAGKVRSIYHAPYTPKKDR